MMSQQGERDLIWKRAEIYELDRFERHLGNTMNWAVGELKGKFEKEIHRRTWPSCPFITPWLWALG